MKSWKVIRAAAIGGSIGWIPPTGAYRTLHDDSVKLFTESGWPVPGNLGLLLTLAACVAFSVRTVWLWGEESWGEPFKAAALVVSLEGLMLFGKGDWLPLVALAALVMLNASASASHLAERARAKAAKTDKSPDASPASPASVREPILPVPARARRMKESPA